MSKFPTITKKDPDNNLKLVKQWIADNKDNIDCLDENGHTFLFCMAKQNQPALVELLLKAGANLEFCDTLGQTAFYWAACFNHVEAMEVLLKKGANVNVKTNSGKTALWSIAKCGNLQALDIILKYNINKTGDSFENTTPLDIALEKGYSQTVCMLLQAGITESKYLKDNIDLLQNIKSIIDDKETQTFFNEKFSSRVTRGEDISLSDIAENGSISY
jgi:ankyrin repeat protein